MTARVLAGTLATLLVLLAMGCSDDDECPTCPPPQPYQNPDHETLSFANIWPSADQNAWVHDLTLNGYEGDPDEVVDPDGPDPELPSMDVLHGRLAVPIDGEPLGASEGLYRHRFDGDVTTQAGVTAQNFVEELFEPGGLLKRRASHQLERLRTAVVQARPDLAGGRAAWPTEKDAGDELNAPILMGGYAFAATDTGLFSYGDLNTEYSWTYLAGSLDVGHEFSIQLVPDLAPDVFLYGRIWSHGDLEVAGRLFANVVECFYVIDMGVSIMTDEQGNEQAKIRSYIYGSVWYAPGVGPVQGQERLNGLQSTAFEPATAILLEFRTQLSAWQAAVE